ncbi:MAG TPA: hypothetical protein VLE47_00945, partial [Candidatus Saccharimonadales bacterium]|nr:hypothetical protein [Candidatus Saccharimonadales bacterium]
SSASTIHFSILKVLSCLRIKYLHIINFLSRFVKPIGKSSPEELVSYSFISLKNSHFYCCGKVEENLKNVLPRHCEQVSTQL